MKKNFLIEYTVLSKDGTILKEGVMRAKNKESQFEAQCDFEEFLKKKYIEFDKLSIKSCKEENKFGDIFGDIFGKSNPFGF